GAALRAGRGAGVGKVDGAALLRGALPAQGGGDLGGRAKLFRNAAPRLVPQGADGVSGPLRFAASQAQDRRYSGRTAQDSQVFRHQSTDRGRTRTGRAGGSIPLSLSASAFGRAASARGDRAGADIGTENPFARRADLGARRFD